MSDKSYTEINASVIDEWVKNGWEWGVPVSHEIFLEAKNNHNWPVLLTPTKPVPKEWFCDFKGAKILGLASGGGQQIPVFSALGADCTVLDNSDKQLENEKIVADRENYKVTIVKADMTQPLPFEDHYFDLIFHPVSNCYIRDVMPVWRECYRILKNNGILLSGLDNGINYLFDEDEKKLKFKLPFNPLEDTKLYEYSVLNNTGIQFSHTIEEQIGGQLKAGFTLTDIYHDTNGEGPLHNQNAPTFYATRSVKNP